MANFQFPGGSVQIDEGRIWEALITWLGIKGRVFRPGKVGTRYYAHLVDGDTVISGASNLSMSDAIAQALQIAASKGL